MSAETENEVYDITIIDCGTMGYADALALQKGLVEKRQKGQVPDTALMVEHLPVITLGARKSENKLLLSEEALIDKGLDVVRVRRGGGATAHNPGQLVLYPIVNIRDLKLGVSDYIRTLETIGIELLEKFGVKAQRRKGLPGLWIENRKIASIGVKIERWVTYHGMAINIQNDLSIFDNIVPCGINNVEMTNVHKETGKENSMAEAKTQLAELCNMHLYP